MLELRGELKLSLQSITSIERIEKDESVSDSSMPLPSASPVYDATKPGSHYASPVKFESNSVRTASTPQSSSKPKERRHKKKHHQSSRKWSESPLTWREQLLQLVAVLLTAAVVYKVTVAAVGWLEQSRRPFCDEQQDPERGGVSFPSLSWPPKSTLQFVEVIFGMNLLSIGCHEPAFAFEFC